LEKAGSFENLKIHEENQISYSRTPFWKEKSNIKVYTAILLLAVSVIFGQFSSESSLPVLGYAGAMAVGGFTLFRKGLQNLFRLKFDMNTLMTIAVIGAAIIGEWLEGAVVVILFAISEAMERYSMDKARQSITSLMDIAPKEALIRRGDQQMKMNAADVRIGDVMIVKPGEKLAMDGRVLKGNSSVNQAAITGESIPAEKTINDEVFAGTLNEEGLLEVEVTKRAEDTTLAKIIHLVEEAQAERAPTQAFVDRFAKYYTPVIIIIAFLTAVIPPLAMGGAWGDWVYLGLAVLVVGCPCALIVSTPTAIVTAVGNAAKHGVLIKGGIHLEAAGTLRTIAFDKTGTLTEGAPEITDIHTFKKAKNDMLAVAAALEAGSQHPIASAFLKKAVEWDIDHTSFQADHFQSLTGRGLKAELEGVEYHLGSPALFSDLLSKAGDEAAQKIAEMENEGKTVLLLGTKEEILSIFAVADRIRPSAKAAISKLNNLGMETIMLTGDNHRSASAIGKKAGVTSIQAALLPEDKLAIIKELTGKWKNVAMVGDGVNDAPALAASTVGIAMGGAGTDTALETADIALMADDLYQLPYTVKLSRKALRIIKQNISFSFALKVLALLLVIPGWLTLWIAIVADMGATLLVTLNSLRLMRIKDK
jgi:Zn2+/Cd2+-exporting ATPase